MKLLKKNQVIIFVIALMLIAAGYLNFTSNENTMYTSSLADSEEMASIGDATLVSTKPSQNNIAEQNNIINENIIINNEEKNGTNIIQANTNSTTNQDEYFTKSRLERDTMYSQMLDNYQKILDKDNLSSTQKNIAQNEITQISELKNAIMITENLIKLKGHKDVIIFVNDKSINVIVSSNKLTKEQIAQIQNIVTRELKSNISDIHISNK